MGDSRPRGGGQRAPAVGRRRWARTLAVLVVLVSLSAFVALGAATGSVAERPVDAAVTDHQSGAVTVDVGPREGSDAGLGDPASFGSGGALDPVARCSVGDGTVEPGEPVTVDASASEDADDFQYARDVDREFGEFTESDTRTFEYAEPGEYTPAVRVWSYPEETTDTATCGTVEVRDETFSADLTHSPTSPSAGETVQFDVAVSGDPEGSVEYRWDWTGDGEVDAVTDDAGGITHRYAEPGRNDATVTVVDESGASATATTEVAVGPVARCTVAPTTVEPGESVAVDASDSVGGDDFEFARDADADFVDAEDDVYSFTYEESGTYRPRVRVWAYPSETTNTATCGTVEVREETFSVNLTADPSTVTAGDPVVYDAAVSGDYEGSLEFRWDWTGDGEVDAVTRDPDGITHRYAEPGRYDATVTVVDESGTTANATTTVRVEAGVTARCSVTPTVIEPGDSVKLDAGESTGGVEFRFARDADAPYGDWTTRAAGEVTYEESGTYEPRVQVRGEDGETTDETSCGVVTVERRALEVSLSFDPASPTAGEFVLFNATVTGEPEGDLEFRWDWTNDGQVDRTTPTGDPVVHQFDEAGTYEVRVTVVDEGDNRASTVREVEVEENETTTTTTTTSTTTTSTTTTTTATTTTTTTIPDEDRSAAWWYSPLEPLSGENVTFVVEDRAAGNLTYEWDVDDDGTYELEGVTAVHAFGASGDRTVVLRVTYPDGGTVTATRTIPVSDGSGVGDGDDDEGPSFWVLPYDPIPGEVVTLVLDPVVPAGELEAVTWDLDGDGDSEAEGLVATTRFDDPGSASVSVEIDRGDGSTDRVDRTVDVGVDEMTTTTGDGPAKANRDGTTGDGTDDGESGDDGDGDDDSVVDEARRILPVPGFGAPVAVLAVLLALLVRARRGSP